MAAAAAAAKSFQSCPTLCDPIDGSPPDCPIPEIFRVRVLEWGAIAFSEHFGYLMLKAIPLEKILILGKIEGRR